MVIHLASTPGRPSNPAQQFDIVTAGGEVRTTVLDGGGARTWLTLGDFNDEWDAALTLSGTTLTSTPSRRLGPCAITPLRWRVAS